MNTFQLSQRLASHLKVDDTTLLPSIMAMDVLAAMNGGIAAYYRELPPIYKRSPISLTLKAPQTLTLTSTGQYANTVTGTPFAANQLGCTVAIAGITPHNEVTGPGTLLDGWLIPELTQVATLYSDAQPLGAVLERIVTDVRCYSQGSTLAWELTRDDELPARRRRRWGIESPVESPPMIALGKPTTYAMDIFTGDRSAFGSNPEIILRVHPFPNYDCIIRFEADLAPRHLTMRDLSTPAVIPVPPHRVEDILLPLCEAELTRSKFWRDVATKKGIMDRLDATLTRRIGQVAFNLAAPRNYCGAPRGF